MELKAALELLSSKNTNDQLRVINSSLFYTKVHLKKESCFIYLGLSFLTKTDKRYDLFYSISDKTIVRQPSELNNDLKYLGKVFKTDEERIYICANTDSFISAFSFDESICRINEISDKFKEENFLKTKKILCKGESNHPDFEIDSFEVFDKEEILNSSIYKLQFSTVRVFFNRAKDAYQRFISDYEYSEMDRIAQEEEDEERERRDQQSRDAQDEVNSWYE